MKAGPKSKLNEGQGGAIFAPRLISRLAGRESLFDRWTFLAIFPTFEDLATLDLDRLSLWLPVAFACGAALTCSLRADDAAVWWVVATFAGLAVWGFASVGSQDPRRSIPVSWLTAGLGYLGLLMAAFAGGGATGLLRADAVAAPILADIKGERTLKGHVERVDRSQNGNWRGLIEVQSLSGLGPSETPVYVRISLKEDEPPLPGQGLICQAIIRPPPGPVVPGAYDFSRRAWFLQLGGVGFATQPCKVADIGAPPARLRAALWLAQARAIAARGIVEAAPGPGGGFLAAIATGDRSWLATEDVDALQTSGLSHIISVSGLHVGILGGLVFLVAWKLCALVPAFALKVDARKIGASLAILATGAYTLFTGAEAPAVRAFVMAGIAFGAIIFNRQAISMRGLAFAAVLVLMVRPESALEPGFQMSFLATAALVAMWEVWQTRVPGETARGPLRTALVWLSAAAATSFVAGLATAPVSAWNFQRLSPWALPANVLSAPIVDFWVAPFALIGATLSPFGAGDWAWSVSSWGLDLTLKIAHWVAGLPGASAQVKWSGPAGPLLLIFATLWVTLWRSHVRFWAAPIALSGLVLWILAPRPVGWIGPEGKAVLATPALLGSSLCRTSGGRFDAVRLGDAAGLTTQEIDHLLPPSEVRLRRGCWTGEGDWEARYVEQGRGRAVLALTLEGKAHAFGKGDLSEGALVLRDGWKVRFFAPQPSNAPWAKARQVPADDGNDAGQGGVRFGAEE